MRYSLFLLIPGISIFIISVIWVIISSQNMYLEEVDCYDEHHSKINELTCEKETFAHAELIIVLIVCSGMGLMVGAFMFLFEELIR